jgi:hypothetical protein
MKSKTQIILGKLINVYDQFRAHKILNKEIYGKEFAQILRNSGGPNRRGLSQYYFTLLRKYNIVTLKAYGYEWDSDLFTLQKIVPKLWQENYDNHKNWKARSKQGEQHHIVQPTLFTQSIMPEQERPIVTANDQLIQRIEALEARLNKITTLFQNL